MSQSMTTLSDRTVHSLDNTPTATAIDELRDEANEISEAIAATLPAEADAFLVVSPRGTCVLLNKNLKHNSWPPAKDADTIAMEIPTR